MRILRQWRIQLLVLLTGTFLLGLLVARALTLAIPPNSDTNVVAYTLYYGSLTAYTNSLGYSSPGVHFIGGLPPGSYNFAVTATGTNGLESDFSAPLMLILPGFSIEVATSTNLVDWAIIYNTSVTNDGGQRFWRTRITPVSP